MKVEVIRAWPRGFERVELELPEGSRVADAVEWAGLSNEGVVAFAVFGVRAEPATPLRDGDRVELLRTLQADPKDARRRRAQARTLPRG